MKRSRLSEEQIIAALREHDAGAAVADLCRKRGMSSATLYAWKANDVSYAKRPKALEEENAKLKRLYADAMLDSAGLKELDTRNNPGGFRVLTVIDDTTKLCLARSRTRRSPAGAWCAR